MFHMHLSPEFLSVTDCFETLQHFSYFEISIQDYVAHEYKDLFLVLMRRNTKLWPVGADAPSAGLQSNLLGTGAFL